MHGHVSAEVTVSSFGGPPSLWSLFPGTEHEGVVPEKVEIVASKSVRISCGVSTITLTGKELRGRSRDVVISGSRAARVRGGTVKLN